MTATDTSIQPSSRVARSEAIVFTELHDTVVMMDVEEGRYYELDRVGARIWGLIESRTRIAEVSEALVLEYDVTAEACRDEVGTFLGELNRLEIVQVRQRDEAQEPDDICTPDAGQPASRQQSRLAWATPSIRVMPIERTHDGSEPGTPHYHEGNVTSYGAGGVPIISNYAAPS